MPDNRKLIADIIQGMIEMIGIPTVNVILQRAILEATQQMSEASLISVLENGRLDLSGLAELDDEKAQNEIFNLLLTKIVLTLSKVVGTELAESISSKLAIREDDRNA